MFLLKSKIKNITENFDLRIFSIEMRASASVLSKFKFAEGPRPQASLNSISLRGLCLRPHKISDCPQGLDLSLRRLRPEVLRGGPYL
jgi:hypothetical protein